ncbi:MAG: hypothetical protein QNK37_30680 [Acidobacteriota bacterium]|nr:hypothetical protein [Acidobacteriota bacterium]
MLLLLACIHFLVPTMQDTETLFTKAPAEWKAEIIPFPLGFAPEIKLAGKEELRFAPGMYQADAPDYFSYAFIWWLDGEVTVDHAMLQENFGHYYRGLYNAVSKTKAADPSTFTVSIRGTRERAWVPGAFGNYRGTIQWVDPFVTEKAQTLNLMIAAWRCEGKTAVYVLASPQESGHPVWQQLKEMRAGVCSP